MLRLQGFRAWHFTRTLSYCKRRGGWCASTPHGIVGAPLLFLPGVLWCALFKRARVTIAASFKVRLPWICISQHLTGRAICRPKKRQCSQINWQHYPSPHSCFKKNTIPMSRKTKLFKNGAFQLQNTQHSFNEFQSGLVPHAGTLHLTALSHSAITNKKCSLPNDFSFLYDSICGNYSGPC